LTELREILWMRVQWKRFRRVLRVTTVLVWLMCSGGIIFIGAEEENQWFYARMALVLMLIVSTGVSVWLLLLARRELKGLDQMAEDVRQQEETEPRKKKKTSKRR